MFVWDADLDRNQIIDYCCTIQHIIHFACETFLIFLLSNILLLLIITVYFFKNIMRPIEQVRKGADEFTIYNIKLGINNLVHIMWIKILFKI